MRTIKRLSLLGGFIFLACGVKSPDVTRDQVFQASFEALDSNGISRRGFVLGTKPIAAWAPDHLKTMKLRLASESNAAAGSSSLDQRLASARERLIERRNEQVDAEAYVLVFLDSDVVGWQSQIVSLADGSDDPSSSTGVRRDAVVYNGGAFNVVQTSAPDHTAPQFWCYYAKARNNLSLSSGYQAAAVLKVQYRLFGTAVEGTYCDLAFCFDGSGNPAMPWACGCTTQTLNQGQGWYNFYTLATNNYMTIVSSSWLECNF